MSALIEARDLKKYFTIRGAMGGSRVLRAVDGVSLSIEKGETFGLVGESGCGKTTLGRTMIRLYDVTGGTLKFEGTDITKLSGKALAPYRQKMQIIFQDPYSSLNPFMNVEELVSEPLDLREKLNKADRRERVMAILKKVGMDESALEKYPHEFSGGQRQRIGIARALALNPQLIVCDEPVSALDVSIQAQIINLLRELQREFGLTFLFISHDLSVVRYIADRVCVMFLGKICEMGDAEALYERPMHPYTRFLLESVPMPNPENRHRQREILTGEVGSPLNPPKGCRFHPRCPYATDLCETQEPPLAERGGRMVACHHALTE